MQPALELHCLCTHKRTQFIFIHIHLPGSFICGYYSNPGKNGVRYIFESLKTETESYLINLFFHLMGVCKWSRLSSHLYNITCAASSYVKF